jgi:adenine-specific DNA-methyltransferase
MAFEIQNRRYTGSKLKISSWIRDIIKKECPDCHSLFDVFAGTGIVTASLLKDFDVFYINDFLYSNNIFYQAFFSPDPYDEGKINNFFIKYRNLDPRSLRENYVSKNYGDKYFSISDSKKIGYIREDLEKNKNQLTQKEYAILLGSLLYSLDRCANTCGHYDAYIKKPIKKDSFVFELVAPIKTAGKEIHIYREDSNILAPTIRADIAYIDPPYSSRQYTRFYHVLENITEWKKPKLFGTAMKPEAENMSEYCKSKASDFFNALICSLNVRYIVVSYNNTYNSKSSSSENKMTLETIKSILEKRGSTIVHEIEHPAFNAGKTDLEEHKEILFVTEVSR